MTNDHESETGWECCAQLHPDHVDVRRGRPADERRRGRAWESAAGGAAASLASTHAAIDASGVETTAASTAESVVRQAALGHHPVGEAARDGACTGKGREEMTAIGARLRRRRARTRAGRRRRRAGARVPCRTGQGPGGGASGERRRGHGCNNTRRQRRHDRDRWGCRAVSARAHGDKNNMLVGVG
jgi:hypothetical protein